MELVMVFNCCFGEAKVNKYLLNKVGLGELEMPIHTLSYLNS